MAVAFEIIFSNPKVRAVLINIFGGIVRCDIIAEGVVQAVKAVGVKLPVVVRLEGTNAAQAREILTEALKLFALRAESVASGEDAVRAIAAADTQDPYRLVLMDWHMPGMDGYSAIRGMREWETQTGNARTPIVVLSSDDLETQRQSAAQCGCSGFLRKPLQLSDLTNLLERVREARTLVA